MAIVTRYFSTSSAGAADGTSWANRAVLFSGGSWSSVITAFAFTAGSDSLKALIGPGTYTITSRLQGGTFTAGTPTTDKPLVFHGCDSSGNELTSPDPDWECAGSAWDDSSLPVLATTSNIGTLAASIGLRLIKFTASARQGEILSSPDWIDWCSFVQTTSNTSATAVAEPVRGMTNSQVYMNTGTFNYAVQFSNVALYNVKVWGQGAAASGSGNRHAFVMAATNQPGSIHKICASDVAGSGVVLGSNASQSLVANRLTLANLGATAFLGASTASQTMYSQIRNSIITGSGGYGVDGQSQARLYLSQNRFRDNTSGSTNGLGNIPPFDSYTTDSDDATEYVNAATFDYRIKSGSAIHGQGYGAGDQPAVGGGTSGSRLVGPSALITPGVFT
jgi:hypothetical protein